MPKKGKKKKNSKNSKGPTVVRSILTKEDGQEYAIVLKMLGDRRLMAKCYDGAERLCHIRGAMRKRVWISIDDHILISLRDFTEKCSDVIHKYNEDEVRRLRKMGELFGIEHEEKDDSDSDVEENQGGFTFDEI